jgi:hypothetical protein
MISPLEGIKNLMRGSSGLPDNMSETEITHSQRKFWNGWNVAKASKHWSYFCGLTASHSSQFDVSAASHELTERVVVLFNRLQW